MSPFIRSNDRSIGQPTYHACASIYICILICMCICMTVYAFMYQLRPYLIPSFIHSPVCLLACLLVRHFLNLSYQQVTMAASLLLTLYSQSHLLGTASSTILRLYAPVVGQTCHWIFFVCITLLSSAHFFSNCARRCATSECLEPPKRRGGVET
jgi:hypothetical protein